MEINPALENVDVTYTLDGKTIVPTDVSVNGDGCLSALFDLPEKGTHTMTGSAEGYEADTLEIIVK